jgi:nitroimidazol reductase NimA-like FMN-containing flavoprotein (pyridoxamine 5'-phosphate oxidase superfamily)
MRRKEKEITDRRIINRILQESVICRIAMVDQGEPYIIPLNYGYSDNALYIHSALKGKKMDILKRNNRVCFEIELPAEIIRNELSCDWSTKSRSVIGYGIVEIITNTEEKKKGLDIIMKHHGKASGNAYKDILVDSIVILKLNIDNITGKQLGEWN